MRERLGRRPYSRSPLRPSTASGSVGGVRPHRELNDRTEKLGKRSGFRSQEQIDNDARHVIDKANSVLKR